MGSTGLELTNKKCKKCKARLYRWWAMDVGGYKCPACGEHYSFEDYWKSKIRSKTRKTKKRISKTRK